MRVKTKYNMGDIVEFYNKTSNQYQIGTISGVCFSCYVEFGGKIQYNIERIKIDKPYIADEITVLEGAICKKINKKIFEKEYAKECAREIAKGESDVKD